jgi:hypothetical protein
MRSSCDAGWASPPGSRPWTATSTEPDQPES